LIPSPTYGREKHYITAWLVDLRAGHSSLPEQELAITVADIQERVSSMKNMAAQGPDMIHIFWLKKLTAP